VELTGGDLSSFRVVHLLKVMWIGKLTFSIEDGGHTFFVYGTNLAQYLATVQKTTA
jgi:hypothetical protein